MDYMEADAGFYSQFVEGGMEAFPFYLQAKRLNACWGDDPEIQVTRLIIIFNSIIREIHLMLCIYL